MFEGFKFCQNCNVEKFNTRFIGQLAKPGITGLESSLLSQVDQARNAQVLIKRGCGVWINGNFRDRGEVYR
ncbi:hypothetical protein AGMMS49990_10370 [Endomicrobiia bacterium]|nr:hypothetical protein AGMMS49990_10370 [Endomicrobiia bacterium]